MRLVPYFNFNGDCREAFEFYREVLGGELQIFRFGDIPMEGLADDMKNKVMHAHLEVDGTSIMGSDTPEDGYSLPKSAHVAVVIDTPEEAERVFTALSDGGTIEMPIGQQPWATRFGMTVDRYGTPWMINCE